MALLNVSDPGQQVVDALSRLSHDADTEVAQNAVVALGIVGAGTNNARLAGEVVAHKRLSSTFAAHIGYAAHTRGKLQLAL
jgi:26S proteasome regulatory subunit N1